MNQRSDPKTEFIGDALLTFGVESEQPAGRTAAGHSRLKQEACWQFTAQKPADGWGGSPLLAGKTDKDSSYWLLGELYGVSKREAERLLHAVVDESAPARQLNGHFLLLAWNARERQWHIWTDRFGTLHAYYASDGKRAALGTFMPSVAQTASRRQLDWTGLTGFFGFGFFPEDRTHFEDVRILPPATHSVLDENGQRLRQERYWQWWHEPNRKRSYDATVTEFGERFEAVMQDLLREGRIALPISGGLDSRSTVAVIRDDSKGAEYRSRLWSYSYGYTPNSVETRIAQEIAQKRKLCFDTYTIGPYLFDRLDHVLACVEGFQEVTQCRQAFVSEEISAHADYLMAAHWGDVWLDDMGLVNQPASPDQIIDHTLHKMEKKGRRWLLDALCQPPLGREKPEAILRAFISDRMRSLEGIAEPDFRVKAFKTDQWSFRWTLASLRMFQAGAFLRLPFYDTRLTDFFGTVPAEFVQGRRLQIDYLKRFAPDLARIRWQAYDANLYRYQHFHTWLLPKRAVKKVWNSLTNPPSITRNWEVQFLPESGQRALRHLLLDTGQKLEGFASRGQVEELLTSFVTGKRDGGMGYTVSALLTFAAWLERYG